MTRINQQKYKHTVRGTFSLSPYTDWKPNKQTITCHFQSESECIFLMKITPIHIMRIHAAEKTDPDERQQP